MSESCPHCRARLYSSSNGASPIYSSRSDHTDIRHGSSSPDRTRLWQAGSVRSQVCAGMTDGNGPSLTPPSRISARPVGRIVHHSRCEVSTQELFKALNESIASYDASIRRLIKLSVSIYNYFGPCFPLYIFFRSLNMTIGQPIQFKKRKAESSPGDATVGHTDEEARRLVPSTLEDKLTGQRVIVVLEKASLEIHHGRKGKEIMNCDDHKNQIQKSGKDFATFRPDIVHDCLKTLLDSPLNKAGKLQIYIHTSTNVLIEVSPTLRIPRTYKRFAGLMAELIDKHKIRAANSRDVLMKVIANPVSQYLPAGGRKIALSVNGKMQSCQSFAKEVKDATIPVTISIGAVSTGEPSEEPQFGGEYSEEQLAISNYGLSAAVCCSKICDAFEEVWNIL